MFIRPKKHIVSSGPEPPELGGVDIRALADGVCRYDLNDMDAAWLELTNEEFKEMGEGPQAVSAQLAMHAGLCGHTGKP